jgi:hypothetical protein
LLFEKSVILSVFYIIRKGIFKKSTISQKNVSTNSAFFSPVDNFMHIFRGAKYAIQEITHMLTTSYPPIIVDNGTVVLRKRI